MLLDLIRRERLLDDRAVRAALDRSAKTGEDLASACWSLKLLPESTLVRLLSRVHGFPGVDLSGSVVRVANLELLPEDAIRRKLVFPVVDAGAELIVAMAEPDDPALYDELRFLSGRKVLRHVAVRAALREAIEAAFSLNLAGETEWRGREAYNTDAPQEGRAVIVNPASEVPGESERAGRPVDTGWTDTFGRPPPKVSAPPGAKPKSHLESSDASKTLKIDTVGAGKTVLIVDDDPDMRELEEAMLAPFKCAVVQSGDGREALSLVRELRPDVMLLDAMLPGMHGFEVCRAIKGDPELRHIGIIMVSGVFTGWRIGSDLKEVYGADHFFAKPFRLEDLSRAVRTLFIAGTRAVLEPHKRDEALAQCHEASQRLREGKLDEAVRLLRDATQKDPFSPEPHYLLGQALHDAGQPYQALASLERAAELRPDLEQPRVLLGDLYLSLGFPKTAREVLTRALDACADANRREEIRARLARLSAS